MPGFDSVIGQQRIKEELLKIVYSSKLPHSFLFYGTSGVGKFHAAINFIELIHTKTHQLNEQVKNKILNLQEPYIKYIVPLPRGKNETGTDSPLEKLSKDTFDLYKSELEEKIKNHYHKISIPSANNIKINSIREIKEFLSFNLSDVKYRFIIIEDAHLMSDEAQNALLKSLEEPPEGFIFILITDKENQLLETIRSRCVKIHFDPLSQEEISEILVKNFSIKKDDAVSVSNIASGSLYEALKFLEIDIIAAQNAVINLLRFSLSGKYSLAIKEINKFISDNQVVLLRHLINLLIMWLADVQRMQKDNIEIHFKNNSETIEKFIQRYPRANVGNAVENLSFIYNNILANLNLNIAIMNIIFVLASLR